MDLRLAVDRVFQSPPTVCARHLAQVLSVSRQTASRHLRFLAESGELIREGAGRGVKYRVGPAAEDGARGLTRKDPVGAAATWLAIIRAVEVLGYVLVAELVGPAPRTRAQAWRCLDGLQDKKWIVLDFAGTTIVARAFVDELFGRWDRIGPELLPVNASMDVSTQLARARRREQEAYDPTPWKE